MNSIINSIVNSATGQKLAEQLKYLSDKVKFGRRTKGEDAVPTMATDMQMVDSAQQLAISGELHFDQKFDEDGQVCANCGVALHGKFCHQCGQNSRSLIKFFGSIITDLMDDIFGYDSRLKHSILPLLFQPGKLSQEYIQGRRFYYVLPFRLYLFSSVLFILGLQLVTDPKEIGVQNNMTEAEKQIAIEEINNVIAEGNNELPPDVAKMLQEYKQKIKNEQGQSSSPKADLENNNENKSLSDQDVSGESAHLTQEKSQPQKLDRSLNEASKAAIKKNHRGFNITFDEKGLEAAGMEDVPIVKDFVAEINRKYKNWEEDPGPLIDEFFRLFPYMMFVLLPLFAMLMKLMYAFSKRYYVEHLVFALHNHSFIYIAVLLMLAGSEFQDYLQDSGWAMAASAQSFLHLLNTLLGIWIFAYILLAVKRFYRQGWGMTLLKTFILSQLYFFLLGIGLVTVILVGAYRA